MATVIPVPGYVIGRSASLAVNAGITADAEPAVDAEQGLRLVGYSCRESAVTPAVATLRIMRGATVAGGLTAFYIELAANGSDSLWCWPGIECDTGITIDMIAGTVDVTIFYVVQR